MVNNNSRRRIISLLSLMIVQKVPSVRPVADIILPMKEGTIHRRRIQVIDRPYETQDDGKDIDCSKFQGLQNLPPECFKEEDDMAVTDEFQRPNGQTDTNNNDEQNIVGAFKRNGVAMNLKVNIRQELDYRRSRLLRVTVTKVLSYFLHINSPFRLLRCDDKYGKCDKYANYYDDDKKRKLEQKYENADVRGGHNNGQGGNQHWPEPGGNHDRNEIVRKSKIWMKHHWTDIGKVTSSIDGFWYYPIQAEYRVYWEYEHLIVDDAVLHNVSLICWRVLNQTIQSGEFLNQISLILEDHYGQNDKQDESQGATFGEGLPGWLTEEGGLYLSTEDAHFGADMYGEGIMGSGIAIPTYPVALEVEWAKREWIGLVLCAIAICTTILLLFCSIWTQRKNVHTHTWGSPFLTEQGVNDILQVGWKYKEQNTGGQPSKLFLQVYDKSKLGYDEDNSMLMGGVEQTAVTANTASLTNVTDRHSSNMVTLHGSTNSSRQPLSSEFSSRPDDPMKRSSGTDE